MKENTKTKLLFFILFIYPVCGIFAQTRNFTQVFPSCNAQQRAAAFSSDGYLHYGNRHQNLSLIPNTQGTMSISKASLGSNSGVFVEALKIIPKSGTKPLQIYDALQRIRALSGKTYFSQSSKKNVPLFPEAIRIEGPQNIKGFLPDPDPSNFIPRQETFYVRLTDARLGHCYYEISLKSDQRGIYYRISNFRSITYGPIPVAREKTMVILIYIEPITEGLALYCLAGTEVSDFVANFVDVPSALRKRLNVFIEWMLEGIK